MNKVEKVYQIQNWYHDPEEDRGWEDRSQFPYSEEGCADVIKEYRRLKRCFRSSELEFRIVLRTNEILRDVPRYKPVPKIS